LIDAADEQQAPCGYQAILTRGAVAPEHEAMAAPAVPKEEYEFRRFE